MALVFQDNFGVWGSGSTSRTNMTNSSNMWVSLGTGFGCTTTVTRAGTHSLAVTANGGTDGGARFSLGAARTSADGYHGFGFAIRLTNSPASATELMYFYTPTSALNDPEYTLTITATGALSFYRGTAAGTLITTSASGLFSPSVYTHVEVKQKIQSTANGTDGEFYLKVNQSQVIAITGTDFFSATTGTPTIETVGLLPKNPTTNLGSCYVNDLYVWNSTGSYCNDWVGNKVSYLYFCDADTATADWSINGVTQGFDAINDTTPDADTTYLAATSANQTSIFEIASVTSTLTGIKALTVQSAIRQDSSGSSTMQVSIGGTTYSDGTDRSVPFPGATSTTYTAYQDHFYVDPDGAGALTPTIISALKLKLKRTA